MKSTKTLTTLAVAAGMALGGIAVAQTTMDSGNSDLNSGMQVQSQGTIDQGATMDLGSGTDTSVLGNQADTGLGSDSSLMLDEPVAQIDRG